VVDRNNFMAKDNKEIEVKTPVSKKLFIRIRKYLERNAKFIKTSIQKDSYYSPKGKQFLRPKYPYEWLSVRERNGKVKINYKHWYPEGLSETTHCDEYETEISDIKELKLILGALKFEKLVSVNKIRLTFEYSDMEIALDEVENLGYFIEIESLNNEGGVKKTRRKLLDYARFLGVKKYINISGGYAAELMRRKKLMK